MAYSQSAVYFHHPRKLFALSCQLMPAPWTPLEELTGSLITPSWWQRAPSLPRTPLSIFGFDFGPFEPQVASLRVHQSPFPPNVLGLDKTLFTIRLFCILFVGGTTISATAQVMLHLHGLSCSLSEVHVDPLCFSFNPGTIKTGQHWPLSRSLHLTR